MNNETQARLAGTPDRGGPPEGGGGVGSPLQARAAFLQNWHWQSIAGINRGACQRGGALHGISSEAGEACAQEWEALRTQPLTLSETLDRLRGFHRKAPFLFFNGNTFATVGRELTFALFSDLPPSRKREAGSAVAHYIAGVLDRDAMVEIIEGLCESAAFRCGDRLKTLRGSARGVIVRLLEDGRVVWRPEGSESELIALPEALLPLAPRKPEGRGGQTPPNGFSNGSPNGRARA
jgi:hypothetical protein